MHAHVACRYANERKAFKGTLGDLQTVKHKLAEMKTDVVVGRAFVDQCIALHAEGKLDSTMASMAKYIYIRAHAHALSARPWR